MRDQFSWWNRSAGALVAGTEVELVPWNTLPRSEYKSKLFDWTNAAGG